jgi:NitT/TauT family transport system substrate-binding protein
VAGEPGLPPYFIMLYLLHKHGLSLSDVQFQDMTTQNAATAFSSGSVDAAAIYEPFLSQAMKQRSGSRVVVSSAQTPGLIVDLIFVREDVLKARRNDVNKLIAGWRQAVQYIQEKPEDAYRVMAAAFNLPENEFRDIASGIRWLDLEDNRRLFGTPEAAGPLFSSFGTVVEVLRRNRPAVINASADQYLIRDFIREAR